jgi:hypothetical protein
MTVSFHLHLGARVGDLEFACPLEAQCHSASNEHDLWVLSHGNKTSRVSTPISDYRPKRIYEIRRTRERFGQQTDRWKKLEVDGEGLFLALWVDRYAIYRSRHGWNVQKRMGASERFRYSIWLSMT